LAEKIKRTNGASVDYVASSSEAVEAATAAARPGDMVLTLGAGSVSQLGFLILERLKSASQPEAPGHTASIHRI